MSQNGQLRAMLPGGGDRIENAVQHLREILGDETDGKPSGLLIFWKTTGGEEEIRFFSSFFGELLATDVAYMSVILADRAARSGK
jgi:hypothetical protein